jgi:hypothetical protein
VRENERSCQLGGIKEIHGTMPFGISMEINFTVYRSEIRHIYPEGNGFYIPRRSTSMESIPIRRPRTTLGENNLLSV